MLLKMIKTWLRKRLGVVINILPEQFIKAIRDGTLLAQLLHSYDVIDAEDLVLVEETNETNLAFQNYLNYLKPWLSRIDIDISEYEINDIVNGDSTAAITLFYDLYLELEKETGALYRNKKSRRQFLVKKVQRHEVQMPTFPQNPLCEPIVNQWDIVNWQKDHLEAIKHRYAKSRKDYENYIETRMSRHESRIELQDESIPIVPMEGGAMYDVTYQDLIFEAKTAMQMEPFEPNPFEAQKIVAKIKRENRHKAEVKKTKLQLEQEFLLKLRHDLQTEKEADFDKVVVEKLLQHSKHEKELAEKIMKIRQQKEIMKINQALEEEAKRKRREEEFLRNLLVEDLEARLKFHDERQRLIEEHRILYEQKQELKAAKHDKVAKDVLHDFVDYAIKMAEYKNEYLMEPDWETTNHWKNLFIKQQPILDLIPIEDLGMGPEDVPEDIYQKELVRRDILDLADLEEYLQYAKQWSINEIEPHEAKLIENGKNIVGYAVHKMLMKKYPVPIPEKPTLCPGIEVAVCVIIEDTSKVPYLKRLLALKNIIVLEMQDALNFCLEAYEIEKKTEFDDPFPDADLKEIAPSKAGGDKGKKGKKEKKPKKEKKSDKKSSKKSGAGGGDKEPEAPTKDDKQAQTPRLFPWEYLNLSNRARLGKLAKAEAEVGHPLADKVLVEMCVEYLASAPDIKGWVLLNFPNNFYQASLLEQALSGKAVPYNYYDEMLNRQSLESIIVEVLPPPTTPIDDKPELTNIQSTMNTEMDNTSLHSDTSMEIVEKPSEELDVSSILSEPKDVQEPVIEHSVAYIRTQKLLPDLVKLAFSSEKVNDMYSERVVEAKSQEFFTCGCNCANLRDEIDVEETLKIQEEVAALLNELISAIEANESCIPALEYIEENDRPLERLIVADVDRDKRKSKIISNPRPPENDEYQTVLTGYIKAMMKKSDMEERFEGEVDPIMLCAEYRKIDGLEKFYCDQGCYYLLQHEEIDSETIKCLAKMIIGDYSLPLKSSFELFGERYLQAQFEVGDNTIIKKGKKDDKKEKKKKGGKKDKAEKADKGGKKDKAGGKKGKAEKKGKGDKKGKGKKGAPEPPKTFEDKEVQYPWVDVEPEEEVVEPKPGEADWEYVSLPIPSEIEVMLASIWEHFEENYVQDFKELFNNRRVILTNIVPYLSQVRYVLKSYIEREDERSKYLHAFQSTLNEIDLNLRDDQSTKNILNANIDNFKNKMLEIVDTKMLESEEKRTNFITDNWIFRQICEFVNNGKLAFQLEVDRYTDTVNFLTNYYEALITKTNTNQYEQFKTVLKGDHIDDSDSGNFNKIFLDPAKEINPTIFNTLFEQYLKSAKSIIDKQLPIAYEALKDTKGLFAVSKDNKPKKGKKKPVELDEDVKEESDRIFEEWAAALTGEYARVQFTLDLIKMELEVKLDNVIKWLKDIFIEIYDLINVRYRNDVDNIDLACDILKKAVDEEVVIRPELTFENNCLVAIKMSLFPDKGTDSSFKLEQINYMVKVLLSLAADGKILEQTFMLLLQDLCYQDADDIESITPPIWRNLTPKTITKFLNTFFNEANVIEWKDFIVCNLSIPFPTSEQLMATRTQFIACDPDLTEIVTKCDYYEIILWFEEEDNLVEDMAVLKEMLYQMYCISENKLNWTALLLNFCRDNDQILGFTKAIELSLGRRLCYDATFGEEWVKEVVEINDLFEEQQRLEAEKELAIAKDAVSYIVDDMMDGTITDTLTITEIVEEKTVEQKKMEKLSMLAMKSSVFGEPAPKRSDTDTESGEFLLDLKYSDSQVGCEARLNTNLAHFVPLDAITAVIRVVLPEEKQSEDDENAEATYLEKVVNIFKNNRSDYFNGSVLSHQFLNDEDLRRALGGSIKFLTRNSVKIIREVIEKPDEIKEASVTTIEEIKENEEASIMATI